MRQMPVTSPDADARIEKALKEIAELRLAIEEVEGERDFYFAKLRDIEIEAQRVAEDTTKPEVVHEFAKVVMDIMYRTEEGFEMPVDQQS